MIDISVIKEIVGKSLLDGANTSLYLFENTKTGGKPISIYNLNIEEKITNLVKELSRDYISYVLDLIKQESLTKIPIYNPDNEQAIFKIDSQQVGIFQEIFKYLAGEKPYSLYDKDVVNEEKLKAWILRSEVVVDGNIEQILLFQRFFPSKMLGSKKLTIFQRDREFELLEATIFSLNPLMDFLFYKKTFIVTKMSSFERIFGFEDFYKTTASQLANDLAAGLIPDLDYNIEFIDIDSVNTEINESTRLAHKFYSARTNGYYKDIAFKKLIDLEDKYRFGLTLNRSTKKWIIDEHSNLTIVASILNDDYELSQLTPNEYLSFSKEKLQP